VYAINDKLSPQAAAGDYELGLRRLVKENVLKLADTGDYPRFDLILLGMGPDGHIASLFPGHPLVHNTQLWIASIEDSPKPPPERITFTLPVINSAANVAFVAAGSGKADKLKQIFGAELPFGELPAQLVAPYKGSLVWFTDKAAVAKL
jgi:6-phosphogluconolactonase